MPSGTVTEIEINRRMRGLDRAFEILDFLRDSRQPARPNEIAIGIDAPKSTAYELVNLLLKAGVLEYADKEGRVFLGAGSISSASPIKRNSTFNSGVRGLSRPPRRGYPRDVAAVHVGRRQIHGRDDAGRRQAVPNQLRSRHANANSVDRVGRLLVSHLGDDEILALIPAGDFRPAGRIDAGPKGLSRRGPSSAR